MVKILDESNSNVTLSSVNGMESVTLPSQNSVGSGDLPLSLNKKGKLFQKI